MQTIEALVPCVRVTSSVDLKYFRRDGGILNVLIVIVPLKVGSTLSTTRQNRASKQSGTIHSLLKGAQSCPSAFPSCSRSASTRLLLSSSLPLKTPLKTPARSLVRLLAPARRRMSTAPVGSLAPATLTQLLEAAHFAAVAHSQQRRKSAARPAYIQHPIHVALLLASPESSLYPNPPVEILQAAVLHDTIEDTDVTAQDLEQKFGKEVTTIGKQAVSSQHPRAGAHAWFLPPPSSRMLGRQEPGQGTAETSADRLGTAQIRRSESVERHFIARSFWTKEIDLSLVPVAEHVKLADKLSNLRDLMSADGRPSGWPVERIQVRCFPSFFAPGTPIPDARTEQEYFVWAKMVTDACRSVNPGLAEELETIYREGQFEHGGKTYRCHPSYSA